MSRRDDLRSRPWIFNMFALLRSYERTYPDKPRVGENLVPADDLVEIGQDPFLDFPGSNISALEERDGRADRLRVRFMGFYGPHGALPLSTTEEVLGWKFKRNDSFIRFSDIFATRFYQLFFRAWSSARRIAQFDRPKADRFQTYIRAVGGIPLPPVGEDRKPVLGDQYRLPNAGLLGNRIRGPERLRQVLRSTLGVDTEIEEFIPAWINFEPGDRSQLGAAGSTLGKDMKLGSRVQSVSDKIRIKLRTESLEDYRQYLPGNPKFDLLVDISQGYLGPLVDIEVAPMLPTRDRPAMMVGQEGAIGHTSWLAPPPVEDGAKKTYTETAIFSASSGKEPDERSAA